MKFRTLCRTASLTAVLVALGACSSSDSEPDAQDPVLNAPPAPGGTDLDPVQADPVGSDPVDSDPVDSDPVDSDPVGSDPVDSDPVDSDPVDSDPVDSDPVDSDPVDSDPVDSDPVDSDPVDSDPVDSDPVDTVEVFVPRTSPGSDMERLLDGLTRQASTTLLDLNQRISQGEQLNNVEEACLGAYEEGFGAPLLAISCDDDSYLSTGNIQLYLNDAAFYDTAECRAAIFNGSADGCILKELDLQISTNWQTPEGGGLPFPVFPGSLVTYSVDNSELLIQNIPTAVSGPFMCNVNLETVSSELIQVASNCEEIVKSVTDEIERLQGL